MSQRRSRKAKVAAVATATAVAAMLLASCSNPYSPPSTQGYSTPTASPSASASEEPYTEEKEKNAEVPTPESTATEEIDEGGLEELDQLDTYFAIDPEKDVPIPDEVKERFGKDSKNIARSALYNIWMPATMVDYRATPLETDGDSELLVAGLHEIFTTEGEEAFVKALKKDGEDGQSYAFQVYPFLTEQYASVKDVDPEKTWDVVVRNFTIGEVINASEKYPADGVNVYFEREVYIPLASGEVNRIDSNIGMFVVPDGEGNWQIADWSYEITANEMLSQ